MRLAIAALVAFAVLASPAGASRSHYLKIDSARDVAAGRAAEQRDKTPGGPWRWTVGVCTRKSATRVTCAYTLDRLVYSPAPSRIGCAGTVAVHRGRARTTSKVHQDPCGPMGAA